MFDEYKIVSEVVIERGGEVFEQKLYVIRIRLIGFWLLL